MKPWDMVSALEKSPGGLDKAKILSSIDPDSEFWQGAALALDTFTTFGIKQLPKPNGHSSSGTDWKDFSALAEKLVKRSLTGNAAKNAVQAFASRATKAQWELWFSRILEKDLSCGVGATTINKHAPAKHKVKLFECQLATDVKHVKVMPRRAFIEAKYDGMRVLWFITKVDSGDSDDPFGGDTLAYEVRAFSRSGKELFNFGQIAREISVLTKLDGFPEEGVVIDGEVISKDFNTLMTQARRKESADFKGIFIAFDMLALGDFMERRRTAPLSARREVLEDAIAQLHSALPDSVVQLSYAIKGIDPTAQQDLITDFFSQQVEAGFEGIMIKDMDAPYQFDRTVHWLKMKPTDTWDLEVVGAYEGEGRLEKNLGGLVCEGTTDGPAPKKLYVNLGGGFSDMVRSEIWSRYNDDPSRVIGTVVEVLADSVSMNQDGTHSLRFPRFLRFREDKEAA